MKEHTLRITEPTVARIIAAGRSQPAYAPARGALLLAALSAGMLWASFTPLDWGPLGWVALVPLLLLVRIETRTRWMYRAIFACGLVNTLATLQWMRLGDPAMYLAWMALAFYIALYFPVFVAIARTAVHRFHVPMTLAIPATWVGLEFLQSHFFTGFSWYYLAHTQYQWIELIQISDLVGAYGVSFVVAMSAACLAGLLPASLLSRLKLLPAGNKQSTPSRNKQIVSLAVSLTLFATVLGYGYFRRAQADFQPGPRIALVQGDFTVSLKHDRNMAGRIYNTHRTLTGLSVGHQPDLIVWPETMFPWSLTNLPLNISDDQLAALMPEEPGLTRKKWLEYWHDKLIERERFSVLSQQAGASMIVGVSVEEPGANRIKRYNSAVFLRRDGVIGGRYHKMHRVIFGEYIPLKDVLPWLHKLTPFADDWGIDKGEAPVFFRDGKWNFAPIICFEDTVPHLVRSIVKASSEEGQRPVDCLINLTNDGWFHGSSELDQHLITAAFRAVECRTPMVRAVNTGISAFIDGDGVIVEPEVFIDGERKGRKSMRDPHSGRWHKQLNAALVDTISLDNRQSLYVRWGDWFAASCCFGCVVVTFGSLRPRRRRPSQNKSDEDAVTSATNTS